MKKTARMFKALSDETRLRILSLLMEGELCVCDLMTVLRLPQSTVSRHLANLRHTGWVTDRREGLWIYYSLNRGEGELRDGLLSLLRLHLPALECAETDRKRLMESSDSNKCA
uniref:ArsR family transcriptional regulator n=1 Tax=Geobacter metallireducens TaxID=28232 RepID=A0A831XDM8_GEOME